MNTTRLQHGEKVFQPRHSNKLSAGNRWEGKSPCLGVLLEIIHNNWLINTYSEQEGRLQLVTHTVTHVKDRRLAHARNRAVPGTDWGASRTSATQRSRYATTTTPLHATTLTTPPRQHLARAHTSSCALGERD